MMFLKDKRVLITGGTGSLCKTLVRRLLTGEIGVPKKIVVFSRDEAKQYEMRTQWKNAVDPTDDIAFRDIGDILQYRIGDIRDYSSILRAVREADVIINTAALKQVPTCEYFPYEAVLTNITGAENLVRAISENDAKVEVVVGVSTDKACNPANVMGMTKAIQERVFIQGNLRAPQTRFVCVRYGNVIASRGSVVPLFKEQIRHGGPVTITLKEMTRFLLSLDQAVDLVFQAMKHGRPGETYIPRIPSAFISDIATLMIGDRKIKIEQVGIRPGEKIHEIMVSEEEGFRTYEKEDIYIIKPIVPELAKHSASDDAPVLHKEFNSKDHTLDIDSLGSILTKSGWIQ